MEEDEDDDTELNNIYGKAGEITEEDLSGAEADIAAISGITPSKKIPIMGEKGRLNIDKILKEGAVNVFNFKNSSEDSYRSTTLFILSELFRLKKEKAEKVSDLPKVLILIEEAHIPFTRETENYLAYILMEVAKRVFKIGRHYFLNICVITQRPVDCHPALMSQINTRIIHKLKTMDDINRVVVGDIEEFKSSIPRLAVGEAMIDCAEWITPLYIQVAPSKSKKIDINYE